MKEKKNQISTLQTYILYTYVLPYVECRQWSQCGIDTNINCGERKILNLCPRAKAHSKSVVNHGSTTSLRHFQQVELSSEKGKKKEKRKPFVAQTVFLFLKHQSTVQRN